MTRKYILSCRYCGYVWRKSYYYIPDFDGMCCEKCKDKDIKIKEIDEDKDYYKKE